MMKKAIVAILLLTFLLTSSGCGNSKKLLESTKEEKITVMTVNGYEVPYEVYRYAALNLKSTYESGRDDDIWLGESGQELLAKLNEDIEYTIAWLYTPFVLAEEYGIRTEDALINESVDLEMEAIYQSYDHDYQAYADAIAEVYMNDSVYRLITRSSVVSDELYYAMVREGEIESDPEALNAIFASNTFIRVKHILISSTNGKTEEENLATAENILSMLENGADFDSLVQQYGEDLSMFNNADGMYIMRGTYHREFEDAAFSLDVGETSGIVKTDAGWSIIRRYEKEDAYMESHVDELTKTYEDSVFNLRMEAVLATLQVEATEKLADYSVFTLK